MSSKGKKVVKVTIGKNGAKYYYDVESKKRISSASIDESIMQLDYGKADECTIGKDGREYHHRQGRRIKKDDSSAECDAGVSCTLSKDGREYYIDKKEKKRISKASAEKKVKKLPECKPKITCTIGKDGRKYYFIDGKRIKTDEDVETSVTHCSKKSVGKVMSKLPKHVQDKKKRRRASLERLRPKVVSVKKMDKSLYMTPEDVAENEEITFEEPNFGADITLRDVEDSFDEGMMSALSRESQDEPSIEEPSVDLNDMPELLSEKKLEAQEEDLGDWGGIPEIRGVEISRDEDDYLRRSVDLNDLPEILPEKPLLEESSEVSEEEVERPKDEPSDQEPVSFGLGDDRELAVDDQELVAKLDNIKITGKLPRFMWPRDESTGLPINPTTNRFDRYSQIVKSLKPDEEGYDFRELFTLWVVDFIIHPATREELVYPKEKIGMYVKPYLLFSDERISLYVDPDHKLSPIDYSKKVSSVKWVFTKDDSTIKTNVLYQKIKASAKIEDLLPEIEAYNGPESPLNSSINTPFPSMFVILKNADPSKKYKGMFHPEITIVDHSDLRTSDLIGLTEAQKVFSQIDPSTKKLALGVDLVNTPEPEKYMYITHSAEIADRVKEYSNWYQEANDTFKAKIIKEFESYIRNGYLLQYSETGIIGSAVNAVGSVISMLNPLNWF